MADINIYGTLRNATPSNKVAYADQVFDSALGKSQAQINQEGAGGARKFRYAHWNVGHFTYYDGIQGSSTPDIAPEDAERMAEVFELLLGDNLEGRKAHIAQFGADFLDQADLS